MQLSVRVREGTTVWGDDGYVELKPRTLVTVTPRKDDVLATRCKVETGQHRGTRGLVSLEDVGLWPKPAG